MYTLDRFARNRYDSAIYKAKLKKNGVRVYYAKQPMPDTPEGIILESVLEGYAEYYSENLARNIKRGIRENALQGLATGGANLLLGYTVGEDRKYAIDPTGAKIVQEIFQLYADGMSATQIIAYCNERGYKTARGNAFNKNSLRTILRNEKYIGTYKLMDIVIPDGMPAIIDKVLFEKVQAMLKHNGKARAKAKAHENYLLTTKLFCGHCGSPMVGESGTSKTGQVHYYYKCTKAKREHACKKKSERKDWIEKLVVRYTVQNVLTDENIALIAKRAMEIIEKESADTTYLDGLNAELKDVQKKIKNLVSAIEQGIITSATKDRLDELEQEKSDVEGRIAREEMKKPLLNESRIRYWLTSFKSGNVDDEDYQRRVIDTLVNSVYVYDDEDGGKRIMLTFNLSGNNTATLTSSDIGCYAPPKEEASNSSFTRMSLRLCIGWGTPDGVPFPFSLPRNAVFCVLRRFKPVGVLSCTPRAFSCLKSPLKRSEDVRAPMCISHPLDARVAALRAAVGCGRTYRRGAAWAWEVMPICAFRRSCTLPCTPCTLSCTPFLAIVCSLNLGLSGDLGVLHTMHTIL